MEFEFPTLIADDRKVDIETDIDAEGGADNVLGHGRWDERPDGGVDFCRTIQVKIRARHYNSMLLLLTLRLEVEYVLEL